MAEIMKIRGAPMNANPPQQSSCAQQQPEQQPEQQQEQQPEQQMAPPQQNQGFVTAQQGNNFPNDFDDDIKILRVPAF
jgi:hypothetical protein